MVRFTTWLRDGWRNGIRYRNSGDTYEIRSAGSDGRFDEVDDVEVKGPFPVKQLCRSASNGV